MTMDADEMDTESVDQLSACHLPFARSYQVEAFEKAIRQNTIVFLETGSGNTLIAIMLLRSYAYLFRKPSPCFSVFLVRQVVLVTQQAEALKMHTDLQVSMYRGAMGVDFWDSSTWKQEVDTYEVLEMTPAILLDALWHSFLTLSMIKVLVFYECHHASGNHPYACIMKEFYHEELNSATYNVPRILGMTASLVKSKGENLDRYWEKIHELEILMNSKVYTCESESVLAEFVPFSTPSFKHYEPMDIPSFKRANLTEKLEKLSLKAAQSLSVSQNDFVLCGQQSMFSETFIKNSVRMLHRHFWLTYLVLGLNWSAANIKGNVEAGLLTSKTLCLVDTLLGYSSWENIQCIIFVDRVIAAIVPESLLAEILPYYNNWKTKYVAGNNSGLQSQIRKKENEIVEDFLRGLVVG